MIQHVLFLQSEGADTTETRCHAELCLLELIRSWELNTEQHYRVTCYISWSPCHDCARELAAFLGENSHLSLRVFASRIYTVDRDETGRRIYTDKYKAGLRQLQAAGAQVAIMASKGQRGTHGGAGGLGDACGKLLERGEDEKPW